MKKICVCNQKGGSTKTSTAILCGLALARGASVLLVDADPQGGLSSFMGSPGPGTYDMIMGERPDIHTVDRHGVQLDYIAADYRLDLLYATIDHFAIKQALKFIDREYDYIIFDTPPTCQGITRAAAHIADEIIIPADISKSTIRPTIYTIEQLSKMEKTGRVVLIGKDPGDRTGYVSDLTRDFIRQLGKHFAGFIDKSATMQKVCAGVSRMTDKQAGKIKGVMSWK